MGSQADETRRGRADVLQGIAAGAFVAVSPELVRESIAGILVRTLTIYSGGRRRVPTDLGDQIASLVLRGLLVDPSLLADVRKEAIRADSAPQQHAEPREPRELHAGAFVGPILQGDIAGDDGGQPRGDLREERTDLAYRLKCAT